MGISAEELGLPDLVTAKPSSLADISFELGGRKTFLNRWNRRLGESMFPAESWLPVMAEELKRVKRGGKGFTDFEAIAAHRALQGESLFPPPERKGLVGRFMTDIRQMVQAIPQIPGALVKEIPKGLARLGGETQPAVEAASFGELLKAIAPGQQLKAPPGAVEKPGLLGVAETPVLRLIPGFGTVSRLLAGPPGWKEISEHPGLAALDISPYAKFIARPAATALRQVKLPERLSSLITEREVFRGAWEAPGRITNASPELVVQGIYRAAASGRKLDDILAEMAPQFPFEPAVSVTSALERLRAAPGRRLGFGPERAALARISAQAERRYQRTLRDLIQGRPVSVFGAKEAKRPIIDLEAALEPQNQRRFREDPAFRRELTETTVGALGADFARGYDLLTNPGRADINPVVLTPELQRFKLAVQRAMEDPIVPWRDPVSGAERMVSLNQVATEVGPLLRVNQPSIPDSWGVTAQVSPGVVNEIYHLTSRPGRAWQRVQRALNRARNSEDEAGRITGKAAAAISDAIEGFNAQAARWAPDRFREFIRAFVPKRSGVDLENWVDADSWIRDTWVAENVRDLSPAEQVAAWDNVADDILIGGQADEWLGRYYEAMGTQAKALREANEGWQLLKQRGFDPVWLHQVHYGKQSVERAPALMPSRMTTPSAWMRASLHVGREYYRDFQVAVSDYAIETLRHLQGAELVTGLERAFGRSAKEVLLNYRTHFGRIHGFGSPLAEEAAQFAFDRDWTGWSPDSAFPWRRPRVGPQYPRAPRPPLIETPADMVIPTRVMHGIELLSPKGRRFEMPAVYDKAMGAWRFSILGMRPSWNLNNIVGGIVMLLGRTGPGVFRYLKEANDMVRADRMPEAISRARIVEILGDGITPESQIARRQFAFGRSLGKLWEKVYRGPYAMNEYVDSLIRSMSYLNESNRLMGKGVARQEAIESGLRLANKVLQDWDAMAPFERAIMRNIFPFWGWAKHIVRYVYSYPWDHPLRASILSNLSGIVMEGADPTLADRFNFGLFMLGDPNESEVFGIEVGGGMNPFSDAARIPTLAGVLSYLNPVFQQALAAAGVDPRTGRTDMFADFEFDPESGRLVAARPGFGKSLIELFPQVAGISQRAQWTEEARALAADNPDAAKMLFWRRLGLAPFVPRRWNISEERIKEAVAKTRGIRGALSADVQQIARFGTIKGEPRLAQYYPPERGRRMATSAAFLDVASRRRLTYDQLLFILALSRMQRTRALTQAQGLQ